MRFMLHHPARCVVVMLVSFSMLSVGCQSTRNGLAKVPGMNWLAADDASSFPGWEGDAPQVELPPPSKDAIPVVASEGPMLASEERVASTNVNPVAGDYPSTGYPSPYDEDVAVTSNTDPGATSGYTEDETVKRATVGGTQKGFYSEDYAAEQPEEVVDPGYASQPAADPYRYEEENSYNGYQDNYDNTYADPYGAPEQNNTVVADANPEFEQLGQPAYDPSTEPMEPPMEDFQAGAPGYGADSQWQEEVTGQFRQGAEAVSQKAGEIGDFTRNQIDTLRDSVGDGVDHLSGAARETYGDAVDGASAAIEGAAEMFGDTSPSGYADEQAGTLPPQDLDVYSDATPVDGPGYADANSYPAETQGGADFPAAQQPAGEGNVSDEPQYSRPRRAVQPWRPGSTGRLGQEGQIQSGTLNQDRRVKPASYPTGRSERFESSTQYPTTDAEQYPSTGAGQYPATGAERYPSTSADSYPTTGTEQYPSTGAGQYPSTGASEYPNDGWESGATSGRLSPDYR